MRSGGSFDSPWPQALLDKAASLIAVTRSLDISAFDETFLSRSLQRRQAVNGCSTATGYLQLLGKSPREMEDLCASLNIGFSEFFRDPLCFAFLDQVLLPQLIEDRKRTARSEIRVWSAGCAAGQEAYSIALLLMEAAANHAPPVSFRIFATDISENELARARNALYSVEEIRKVPFRYIESWFRREEHDHRLSREIRRHVDFSCHDLLDEYTICPPVSIFGDFDLVFCCNLLFYYATDVRNHILRKIHCSLSPGGYLVTGATEKNIVEDSGNYRTIVPPVPIYRKAPSTG